MSHSNRKTQIEKFNLFSDNNKDSPNYTVCFDLNITRFARACPNLRSIESLKMEIPIYLN